MSDETEAASQLDPVLPDSVRHFRLEERDVYVIGTAHVSKQSVVDVEETIDQVKPDTICVELCQSRYQNIINREQWKKTDIVKIVRQGKAMLLLTSLILTSFQRRIGKQLGVMPGAEMMAAIERAKETESELVLADRDIQITLRRTWGMLGFWDKLKMAAQITGSLFVTEEIDEKLIEEIKSEERLTDVLDLMASEFPLVKGTLIDERDTYLAQEIRQAPGQKIVAVVGAGHVPGISQQLEDVVSVEPLLEIPKPALWPKFVKWGIPGLIVALFIYGFFTSGAEHSLQSVTIWFLVNGALSALGAALALAHPITIVTAFVAAPLTSLNPMIAAGWVTGLVQAFLKKPTVKDLEDLPDAITSLKGFWTNPVSRILLVVVLSNLGSSLGTLISGSWIAARTI